MKVLQIIDSLHGGGAEKMAVTYANMLQENGVESFLCCTREEGLLKKNLNKEVGYIFLDKKNTLHLNPVLELKKFIKQHNIGILHAHGTSFFTATVQKLFNKDLKLVWHDHNGKRATETKNKNKSLIVCSYFFNAVITVNPHLLKWANNNLKCRRNFFLPNFVRNSEVSKNAADFFKTGKHLICVANFRTPKNHMNLLKAFTKVVIHYPESILHLVGKDYGDLYSENLKLYINHQGLQKNIIFHGVQNNVQALIRKADIGILSSDSEGLPMVILEYGQVGIGVVCTDVGECKYVVNNYGEIVQPNNSEALADKILLYLQNSEKLKTDAMNFNNHVQTNYTEETVFPQILKIYNNL